MRRIKASELVPGMVTAEDVYNYDNQLILPKGLILNDRTITKLAFYSVLFVRVEDNSVEEEVSAGSSEISYSERVRKNPEFIKFCEEFKADEERFKSAINDLVEKGTPLSVGTLMTNTLGMLASSTSLPSIFDMLHNMREYDDSTFVHCMNVSLICNVLARWLRMSDEEIYLATLSGLLHDIGKVRIPDNIIKKPGKLTGDEYTLVKEHPREGYELLKNSGLNPMVLDAVLLHHERCDGLGYPFGLDASRIGTYAKMVSIADVYDAMTSARVYRGPLCPFKAIALFESEGLQKYDPHFIMTFLENVSNTYLLNSVRLTNGITGKIVFIHREKLSSPTIQTEHGFIDLSIHPDLAIDDLI